MPLNPDKLLALDIPDVEHTYGPKDCILYALGLGLGQDPTDEQQLAFVYEKHLKVLPTFPVVQGYSAYTFRRPELGITWTHVVHGEHAVRLHAPIAPEGTVIGRSRILDVIDKGAGKGALIYSERRILDKTDGRLLATINQTTFCRADGGFGGAKREAPAPHALPERAPDLSCDLPTRPETALIYRLSGDVNPCSFLGPEYAAGSLRHRSLAEIWRNSPGFCRIRALPTAEPGSGAVFSGGCRARALVLNVSINAPDPWVDSAPTEAASGPTTRRCLHPLKVLELSRIGEE